MCSAPSPSTGARAVDTSMAVTAKAYEVLVGIAYRRSGRPGPATVPGAPDAAPATVDDADEVRLEAGAVVTDLPRESIAWLLEAGAIRPARKEQR